MKYMGSKNYLLSNGLGKLLSKKAKDVKKFYDLFSGSSAVSWYVAQNVDTQVIAGDIQEYSIILANSVLKRVKKFTPDFLKEEWINSSRQEFIKLIKVNKKLDEKSNIIQSAYGGYYFSPQQALIIDILLKNLPKKESQKSIAQAALIIAASQCSASPGHTAQPFKPTRKAARFITESWHRDPFKYTENALKTIALKYSRKKGKAILKSANILAKEVKKGDLVFIDPPYSGVHYSRFYHVLETIARGEKVDVTGEGRYPPKNERPSSKYSMISTSKAAIQSLIEILAEKQANVIITFPKGETSNGLSGNMIKSISKQYFNIEQEIVENTFSTLGGNVTNRPARQKSNELILSLEPKY